MLLLLLLRKEREESGCRSGSGSVGGGWQVAVVRASARCDPRPPRPPLLILLVVLHSPTTLSNLNQQAPSTNLSQKPHFPSFEQYTRRNF